MRCPPASSATRTRPDSHWQCPPTGPWIGKGDASTSGSRAAHVSCSSTRPTNPSRTRSPTGVSKKQPAETAIEPVDYFEKAADWEFSYATPSGRRHVIIRGVVTSDKRAYGIYWSTPDTQWTESRSLYRTFTKTFQPAS